MLEDKLVEPLDEPHPDNAPGAFYVMDGVCITCGAPKEAAPNNIGWTSETHCIVKKQAETPEEIEALISATIASCVACLRYCGTDPKILQRFRDEGYEEVCDALISNEP